MAMMTSVKASRQFKGMLIAHAVADVANVKHTSSGLAGWRCSGQTEHAEPWRAALRGRVLGKFRLQDVQRVYPDVAHWLDHPLPLVLAPGLADARAQGHRISALFARFAVSDADAWAVLGALPLISDDVDAALVIALGRRGLQSHNPWLVQRCVRMLPRLLALACCNRPLCFVRYELWALVWTTFGEHAEALHVECWPCTLDAIDASMRFWHDLSLLAVDSHLIPQVYSPQRAIFSRLFQGYFPQERQQLLAAMRANERPWTCAVLHRADMAIRRAMAAPKFRVGRA